MLKLIREGKEPNKGIRKTFYDAENNLFVKKYNYLDRERFKNIRKLIEIAYPNNLIEARRYSNSMRFVYKGHTGETLYWEQLQQDKDLLSAVEIFCINDLNRTWPIAHCDWSPTNILLDNQQLKLIDFDNISRKTFTNKDDAIRAIKQSLRGISEDKY